MRYWGKSLAQAEKLGLAPADLSVAKERYKSQMKSAKRRGIVWRFSFDRWVLWWAKQLGPDWLHKRGRFKGQYVMARKGDVGPYSPKNVECLLTEDNLADRIPNGTFGDNAARASKGESNGRARLTEEQVLSIYEARGTYTSIAKEFGVTVGRVSSIKNNQTWVDVTSRSTKRKRVRLQGGRYDLYGN